MTNRNDADRGATPAEGVRILGAEEAQAAMTGENQPDDHAAVDDRTRPIPAVAAQPTLDLAGAERAEQAQARSEQARVVASPSGGASWSARASSEPGSGGSEPSPAGSGSGPAGEPDAPTGEVPPLPHWTEPPTGAVPAIFADDSADTDDDLDAWATISGSQPRFRNENSDWAEADFHDDLSGEHERLGALSEAGPVDEDAEFAEAFAEKVQGRPAPPVDDERRAPEPVVAAVGATAATAERPSAPRRPRPAPAEHELSPPGPAKARDLPTAIMTAATIVVVALICFQSRTWTALLAALIIAIASVEFCKTLHTKALRPATLLVLLASASFPLALKHYGTSAFGVYLALIVLFSLLWFLWEVTPGRPLVSVATTVLAFAYVGGLGGFAGLLLAYPDGIGMVVGVVICVIAYDVVGFFVGSQFGRTPIAPRVSPNKSVQGTVAGMVASVFFGAVVVSHIHPWSLGYGFWLGLLVAFGAFFGDLAESLIKRDLGVKDFGTLLPGHGGVLDRFDGLLFCLPIAYYLVVALKIV